jgi:NADPH:quinone reductase-like Zn-dependent oxidoreductase
VIQYEQFGPAEVLQHVQVEPLTPGPGQVVLEPRAIGVNPAEVKRRAGGRWPAPPTFPVRPGSDAAGIVTALGPGVTGFAVGDEVVGRGLSGAYAEQVLATTAQLVRKPAGLSFAEATLLGIPVGTAYQVLVSTGVGAGDTLLVHGAAGGVGQAAVQLARHLGATVLGTARPERHDRVREIGAIPVEYGPGLVDRVRQAAPGGVTVALDTAGTDEALQASLDLVADRTRIVTVGAVDAATRWGVRTYSGNGLTPEQAELRRAAALVALELWTRGAFSSEVGSRYPLADAAAAHRESEGRHAVGKIVLVP